MWGEEHGEEFLEYFAQHRMTNARRERIWASGRAEGLPAPMTGYCYRQDASHEKIRRLEEAFFARNRQLFAELRGKGLLPSKGHNLPAHEITEFLISAESAEEDRPPRA